MISITIYDRITGAILRSGAFPNIVNANANVREGEGWVQGQWDGAAYYIRDEQVVPRLLPVTADIRPQRDQLLAASDWTQLPDAPLTGEQQAAWRDYRQALRDLPDTGGEWPVPPDFSKE